MKTNKIFSKPHADGAAIRIKLKSSSIKCIKLTVYVIYQINCIGDKAYNFK